MSRTYVLTYDEAPKSLNAGGTGSRRHWSAAAREKKKWQDIWTMLLLERRVPRGMTFCKARVLLEFRKPNRRDIENYRSAVSKPFADALAPYGGGGWLPDDTRRYFARGG